MRRRLGAALGLAALAWAGMAVPLGGVPAVRAAEYTLVTDASYVARPAEARVEVTVDVTFTNTTPDPAGRFSVFDEVKLAVHDEAAEVAVSDADGELDVAVAQENEVNVATIELRDDVRYEEAAEFQLSYRLDDSEDPQLRVRPSVVVFPAWSFGTAGEVTVSLPAGYQVRVDGDALTESDEGLVSGPIADPSKWLALVTATRPGEYSSFPSTVPLAGGTADLQVRSFADDEAWGERTLALVERALPLLEEQIGLPYPRLGPLVLTETVATDSVGIGEDGAEGAEIPIAFDQPDFTVLHQLAHVWISPALVEPRWLREGLASHMAELVARQIDVQLPYEPAAVTAEEDAAAFRLDAWLAVATAAEERYGYAASWAVISELAAEHGPEALRTVLARSSASVGPYQSAAVEPDPTAEAVATPSAPLTTRAFLDHLQTVTGAPISDALAEVVLVEDDVALLGARAEAREQFDRLLEAAGSWGAPDPTLGAMTAWSFDEGLTQIADALAWIAERDAMLAEMEEAGLSAPDRLQQAYRAYGGGPEAQAELDAERAVLQAYVAGAEQVNRPRSFVERIGLLGGPDPSRQLALASGRFAEGDLRGSVDALTEADRMLSAAETSGMVRLASVALVILLVLGLAVFLVRRRPSYTAGR